MSDPYRMSQAPEPTRSRVFSPLRPFRNFITDALLMDDIEPRDSDQGGCMTVIFSAAGCAGSVVTWFIGSSMGLPLILPACIVWGLILGAVAPWSLISLHAYLRSVMHLDDAEAREWWEKRLRQ